MNTKDIENLSYDLIFRELEKDASSFYKNQELELNDGKKIILPKTHNGFDETTFSTHSLIRSISLVYSLHKLDEYIIENKKENNKFDIKYLRYLSHYYNDIDLTKLKDENGSKIFCNLITGLQLFKIHDYSDLLYESTELIFNLLLKILVDNNYPVLKSFMRSLLTLFDSKYETKDVSDDVNEFIFSIHTLLFENFIDFIMNAINNKNKFWKIFFDLGYDFGIHDKEEKNVKCGTYKNMFAQCTPLIFTPFNQIQHSLLQRSRIDEINILLKQYNDYLNNTYNYLKNIKNDTKDKYIKKYIKNYDAVGYVIISNYLNEVKTYLKNNRNEYSKFSRSHMF